jgi:peptide chain release factor 1
MKEKAKRVVEEYERLQREIFELSQQGEVSKVASLTKRAKDIEPVYLKAKGYLKTLSDLVELRELLEEEKDEGLKREIRKEMEEDERRLESLEEDFRKSLVLMDPLAHRSVIVEVRAGTGGEEAALFAKEVFDMYSKYAAKRGWKLEVLDSHFTELGGVKLVSFSLSGREVYMRMRYESGTHRVQRVPVTESGGRIHTSAVTVAVLLEPEEIEVEVNPDEIKMETFRASGAGGQHVNKTSSAVRLIHIPTGLVVECQEERSQFQNREKALRMLRAKLYERELEKQKREMETLRKRQVGSGDRSEKIRTYNFPQNRVTDHRINLTIYRLQEVLEGDLDLIIDELIVRLWEM